MPRQAYTASEAARRLGISLDTLRRWDRQGRIKTTRDEANRRVVAAKEVERLLGRPVPHELSARNRLTGVVRNVRIEGLLAQVEMDAGPFRIVSVITSEAAEELALEARRHGDRDRQGDLDHGGAMRALAAIFALVALVLPSATGAGGNFTVYAAASLTEVFPKISAKPRYNFAGSDQLALQIRQGAPADVYAAASPKYTQLLYHDGLVRKPVTFATNKLIVIVPKSNPAGLHSVYDLRRSGVKLVIGDQGVPIGSYTRQLLDALGIKDAVMKNVVSQETDVKGIVAKVALGEADAGFVYVTDARPVASKIQKVLLPAWAQPPIRYQIAMVSSTPRRVEARSFMNKVLSKRGRLLLKRAGFGLPKK